jgi:transposase
VFDKLIQVLRFGCSYEGIADTTCSASTLRARRDEWIRLGLFAKLARIARDGYDRIVGLALDHIAIDGCITKAPGGGECAGPSPVDRRKQGLKRSVLVEDRGIPLGRILAGANRHDSPLLGPTLDRLDELGPLPEDVTVHLDAGYDSGKTRDLLAGRGLRGEIAHKGEKAPIQATHRWHVERTNAWHNAFNRLKRCYERREKVIDAFFDLADAIITVRRLIRCAWTSHRWDTRPTKRPAERHRQAWDQGGEQGSVGPVQARPRVGSAEYGHLVAENEELDVLGR